LIEIPVEPWEKNDLKKIVDTGYPLLNVKFDEVVEYIIESCFDSVGVFQEICKESCLIAGIENKVDRTYNITKLDVNKAIEKKLQDYSSRHLRCLETFIEQKAKSSQETPLYIPYYFVKILLTQTFEDITDGLKRRFLQESIKQIHHRPDDVRPSDMGYFLRNLVANQINKSISPPLFDFDNSTNSVKIIDSTFYFFMKNSNSSEILENLIPPEGAN
jgi:hypothetical protein